MALPLGAHRAIRRRIEERRQPAQLGRRRDQRRQAFGVDLGQGEHHVGGADRLFGGGVAGGPGPPGLLSENDASASR